MTTLCKWCITSMVCLFIAVHGAAQTVAITSSQETNSSYKMDETWAGIVSAAGYHPTIHPTNFLNDSGLKSKADILVIASGTTSINAQQRSNILEFVNAGGSIYIQSEYLPTLDGNITFKYLLDKTGSTFSWNDLSNNNIGPMNIINGFETGFDNNQLDYFWYGTDGCGDGQVTPFLEVDGKNYAFYYRSVNSDIGNIITNTDHDWIRRIEDNKAPRVALMHKILDVLVEGIETNSNYQLPTISLESNINFCTANSISATVSNANDQNIQWYINSAKISTGPTLDIQSLVDGDTIYAEIIIGSGCGSAMAQTESIVVATGDFAPAIPTTFGEQSAICQGDAVKVTVSYDSSLPNIRHNWFLNGQDTPIKTDFFAAEDFRDGDVIEHSMTYFNGCQDIELITEGSVKIEYKEITLPSIQIIGQTTFCQASIARLNLSSLNIENPIIRWHIHNTAVIEDQLNIEVEASAESKEVYATIKFHSDCKGWITLSTPVVQIDVENLNISLDEKANHDCEHGEGFIEVYSNDTNATYSWSNGETGNYITGLSEGSYSVTATSSNGCTSSKTYEISTTIFPLLESMDVTQPTCNSGDGFVQLNLADNNLSDIQVQWINSQGQTISNDHTSAHLESGNYSIQIDINGNCEEIHHVSIEAYHEDYEAIVDTMVVEHGEQITLRPNMTGHEGYSIEWQAHPDLSCMDCFQPELMATEHHRFIYDLISDHGCRIRKAILVLVKIRDPYYAPSGFSPNNDGINDYYKIYPREDVFPTSSLRIFDRWGSLIHEEENNTHGWDGKSFGRQIQKGIYVFFQEFEDASGKKYQAKGSITIF